MATLAGSTIASTYALLLKIDSSGIDTTLRAVEDGDATDSALLLATNKVEVKPGSNDANAFEVSQADGTAILTVDSSTPKVTITGDTYVANGSGVIVGHTSQETISDGGGSTDLVPEVQILGTSQADASLMLAAFSTTATSGGAPLIALVKGGNGTIGSHTVVTDGEELGNIIAYGDDGTDLESPAASIQFEVDGTPGSSDMPGRILFNTTADGATALTERMRISQDGTQNQQVNYIVNEQGRQDHVANTMSAPYYRFDGSNDEIDYGHPDNMEWQSTSGALEFLFTTPPAFSGDQYLIGRRTGGGDNFFVMWYSATSFGSNWTQGDTEFHVTAGSATFEADTTYHLVWSFVNGTSNAIYINGVAQTLTTDTNTGGTFDLGSQPWELAKYISNYAEVSLHRFRFWNTNLSATEVKQLYSGASVPYKHQGANQTDLASGWDFTSGWATSAATVVDANTFRTNASATGSVRKDFGTKGKRTRIRVAGTTPAGCTITVIGVDTLTNHSGSLTGTFDSTFEFLNIDDGYRIQCVNTIASTKDTDITTFTVTEIGAVVDCDGTGAGASRWDDKSGNDLHGTVSGATVENAPADADSGLTYEEGTWTGVVSDGSNNATMSNSTGYYTKVGRIVHVSGVFTVNGLGSVSGSTRLTGLPFTCVNNNGAYAGGVAYASGLAIAQYSSVSCLTTINATYATLWLWDATTGVTALQGSEISADGEIALSFSYSAA